MKVILSVCVLMILCCVQGGDILIIQMMPFTSTTVFFKSIIKILAPYHQITMYSIVSTDISHPNVTVSLIEQPKMETVHYKNIFEDISKETLGDIRKDIFFPITADYIKDTFRINKDLQNLMKANKTFDLFFLYSHISEHLLLLAPLLRAQVVLISPSTPFPWYNEAIGNPNFMSYDYSFMAERSSDNFFNRLRNFGSTSVLTAMYKWLYLPKINKVCKEIYPPGIPTIEEVYKNVSLVISNTPEALGYSRPDISNLLKVGGLHCHPPEHLSEDLENFISESGENGFIYFSLGLTIQAQLPKEVLNSILNVFKKLPQKILWKNNMNITDLPKNIKVSSWFPQQNILGHKKIKLFMTHGGMMSIQEAVCHGVPILAIPIAFDQLNNVDLAQKLGYGRVIKFNEISEEKLMTEIIEIISKPQYKEKAKDISMLFKDELMRSAEKLRWWVDYLIRHKRFPLYRPKDNRYSSFYIIETDILLFILMVIVFVGITLKKIICVFLNIKMKTNIKIKAL